MSCFSDMRHDSRYTCIRQITEAFGRVFADSRGVWARVRVVFLGPCTQVQGLGSCPQGHSPLLRCFFLARMDKHTRQVSRPHHNHHNHHRRFHSRDVFLCGLLLST